jgi:hypothetical protein
MTPTAGPGSGPGSSLAPLLPEPVRIRCQCRGLSNLAAAVTVIVVPGLVVTVWLPRTAITYPMPRLRMRRRSAAPPYT